MATSDDKLKLEAAIGGSAQVDANSRVRVLVAGVAKGVRRTINLIAGPNVQITASDDATDEEVEITIGADAGAVGTTASTAVTAPGSASGYTPAASTVQGHLDGIGTALGGKQADSAKLTAFAGLTWAADKLGYFTGAATAAVTTLTSFARTLLDDADAATARATLGLAALAEKATIDSSTLLANDVVTYAKIQNVSATDKLLGRSSSSAGDVEEIACTAAGRALIDDANAAAQRVTMEVAVEQIDIIIETPTATTYPIVEYAEYPFTINRFTHKTASGSIVGKIQINGADVVGLTAMTFDSSQTQTDAASANSVPLGGRVTLVTSSPSTPGMFSGALKITR